MSKSLIIAEKPSVAADIARALGGFTRHDDYFESDRLRAVVGGRPPARDRHAGGRGGEARQVDVRAPAGDPVAIRAEADREEREPPEDAAAAHQAQGRRPTLINACDAGREGELIFRYIAQYAKTAQARSRRLWLQSMTTAAIRDGFAQLRTDAQMRPLADAAVCRSEADWLVGINGTRAMTAFNSKSGGFQLTTVGRVQTPTLAILVEREEKIRAFAPRNYWEVHGTFRAERRRVRRAAGSTRSGRRATTIPTPAPSGCGTRRRRSAIVAKCAGKPGIVTEEAKPTTQGAPLLYDLTSTAARSQRPLRLVGAHDALARAGALREAQGAHVSADRFARAARGLPRHRQGDDGGR